MEKKEKVQTKLWVIAPKKDLQQYFAFSFDVGQADKELTNLAEVMGVGDYYLLELVKIKRVESHLVTVEPEIQVREPIVGELPQLNEDRLAPPPRPRHARAPRRDPGPARPLADELNEQLREAGQAEAVGWVAPDPNQVQPAPEPIDWAAFDEEARENGEDEDPDEEEPA